MFILKTLCCVPFVFYFSLKFANLYRKKRVQPCQMTNARVDSFLFLKTVCFESCFRQRCYPVSRTVQPSEQLKCTIQKQFLVLFTLFVRIRLCNLRALKLLLLLSKENFGTVKECSLFFQSFHHYELPSEKCVHVCAGSAPFGHGATTTGTTECCCCRLLSSLDYNSLDAVFGGECECVL